jgi:molybdopterin converting factor small subunit
MPTVWIPSLMQKLTGGVEQVTVTGATVRQIIDELEAAYPGFRSRLVNEEEDRLRPDVAVAVDGEISNEGMRRKVGASSEVNFLPAMSGG